MKKTALTALALAVALPAGIAQADKLDDPAMRSMYLQHGPYNRQLLSA